MKLSQTKLGLDISEKEYRDIDRPSYSYLADVAKSEIEQKGSGIHKIIHGVKNDGIEDLDGVMIGTIVDKRITENKDPDSLVVTEKKPAGKMLTIIRTLVNGKDYLKDSVNIMSVDNDDDIASLCEAYKYKKTKDARVAGVRNYTEYILALDKYRDPFIVSKYIYSVAGRTCKVLKEKYDYIVDPSRYNLEMLTQVKLLGEVNGVKCKGMLDFVFINHAKKLVIPMDLKTGAAKEPEFYEKSYLRWLYYIQGALYKRLLKETMMEHPLLKDYEIYDFQFMYCGRMDFVPLTFKVDALQDSQAMLGFTHLGISYPGVNELLQLYADNIGKRQV